MGRKSIKEMYWLLCGSDELFDEFGTLVKRFTNGELLNEFADFPVGTRQMKELNPSLFRCFEGGITEEQILVILRIISDGGGLLKKDPKCVVQLNSMEELAKTAKAEKVLERVLLEYYISKDKVPDTTTFEDLKAMLDINTFTMNKCRRAAGEDWILEQQVRSKKKHDMPSALVLRLENIWSLKHGGPKRNRMDPYKIFVRDRETRVIEPNPIQGDPKCAPLVIVDLARRDLDIFGDQEVLELMNFALGIGLGDTKFFVFFCRPGKQVASVLWAMESLVDFYKRIEIGSFRKKVPMKYTDDIFDTREETVILAAFSVDEMSIEAWEKMFRPTGRMKPTNYFFSLVKDKDFGDMISTKDAGEKMDEDKVRLQNLTDLAPRWEMLQMGEGLVNKDCKPFNVIKHLVQYYSETADTVLDFFSGGQVLKVALFSGRECFSVACTNQEGEFLKDYPDYLRQSELAEKTWKNVEVMHNGGENLYKDDEEEDDNVHEVLPIETLVPPVLGKTFVFSNDSLLDNLLQEKILDLVPLDKDTTNDVGEAEVDKGQQEGESQEGAKGEAGGENQEKEKETNLEKIESDPNAQRTGKEIIQFSPSTSLDSSIIETLIKRSMDRYGDANKPLGHLSTGEFHVGYRLTSGRFRGRIISLNNWSAHLRKYGNHNTFERVYENRPSAGEQSQSLQASLGSNSIYEYGSLIISDDEGESSRSKDT